MACASPPSVLAAGMGTGGQLLELVNFVNKSADCRLNRRFAPCTRSTLVRVSPVRHRRAKFRLHRVSGVQRVLQFRLQQLMRLERASRIPAVRYRAALLLEIDQNSVQVIL